MKDSNFQKQIEAMIESVGLALELKVSNFLRSGLFNYCGRSPPAAVIGLSSPFFEEKVGGLGRTYLYHFDGQKKRSVPDKMQWHG